MSCDFRERPVVRKKQMKKSSPSGFEDAVSKHQNHANTQDPRQR